MFSLPTLSVPRTVTELDLSNNPILSPDDDARASVFVRMLADDAHARHITALNLSQTGLHVVPKVVPACRCLTSLRLAFNRIVVYLMLPLRSCLDIPSSLTRNNNCSPWVSYIRTHKMIRYAGQ